jgi:hypothetical protein
MLERYGRRANSSRRGGYLTVNSATVIRAEHPHGVDVVIHLEMGRHQGVRAAGEETR